MHPGWKRLDSLGVPALFQRPPRLGKWIRNEVSDQPPPCHSCTTQLQQNPSAWPPATASFAERKVWNGKEGLGLPRADSDWHFYWAVCRSGRAFPSSSNILGWRRSYFPCLTVQGEHFYFTDFIVPVKYCCSIMYKLKVVFKYKLTIKNE